LDQAIHSSTEAIRLDPDQANVYHHRSLAHAEKGHREQAEADQKKAVQLSPELDGQ
jgi:Tfp pilus assembly protein PilF